MASMRDWRIVGYEVSNRKNKKYQAILKNSNGETMGIHFGDKRYENYHDLTKLNAYSDKLHGDPKRRKAYKARHKGYLRKGYYTPAWFSYHILW